MKVLAKTTQQTIADPEAIFQLWLDVNNWNKFDESVEWARLDEAFSPGNHFSLKPKGGPKVKATIVSVKHNREFTNTSQMPGAELKFIHTVIKKSGSTSVSVIISIDGPLSWLWSRILGKDQQSGLEKSVSNLIRLAEKKSS
jgi:hypothetical protein